MRAAWRRQLVTASSEPLAAWLPKEQLEAAQPESLDAAELQRLREVWHSRAALEVRRAVLESPLRRAVATLQPTRASQISAQLSLRGALPSPLAGLKQAEQSARA